MSFVIVVRKNLSSRRSEIDLYRTLGFADLAIEQILYRENLLVPLYAIAVGVVSSLIGVSATLTNASIEVWLLALLFTALFVACVVVFIRKAVRIVVRDRRS
jgi:ABC-type antimicrobial peptide transport system permease subunit